MLALLRKPGQEVVIDEHITIRVLAVDGQRVKLGVEAPSDVLIRRRPPPTAVLRPE